MFTSNTRQNGFGTAAALALAFSALALALAASVLVPQGAEAQEAGQGAGTDVAAQTSSSSAVLDTSGFQKLEAAGTGNATAQGNSLFEAYLTCKSTYNNMFIPIYVKTKYSSSFSLSFTDSTGNEANGVSTTSISADDVALTENNSGGAKLRDAPGRLFAMKFEKAGWYTMKVVNEDWRNGYYYGGTVLAEFKLRVQHNYTERENAYIDSLIKSQTKSSMDSFEKMTAICNYLYPKMKYLRTYKPKPGERSTLCSLLEDYGTPWWKDFTGDSYSTPAILCKIAKRVGGFTDIHNCFGDYTYGSIEWQTTHYFCKCTGTNKKGKKQTKKYSICPWPDSNQVDATDASELPKVDFNNTSKFQKLQGGGKTPFLRLAGGSALTTMKAIVDEGWSSSEWAVVATNKGYHDALSASGLAGLLKAPVMLTEKESLSSVTKKLLKNKKVKKVIVVGGTAAVSAQTEKQIRALGVSVKRVAGSTAAATAVKVYKEGLKHGGWGKNAVVATSKSFQDALSIAPFAYAKKAPIFLTDLNKTSVRASVVASIKKGGFTRTVVVGGEQAVSSGTDAMLPNVKRLAGGNCYSTSTKVARFCLNNGMKAANMGVTRGDAYLDALAGGALLGKRNSIVVLVDRNTWNSRTYNIERVIAKQKADLRECYIFGGNRAVSCWVENAIAAAAQ